MTEYWMRHTATGVCAIAIHQRITREQTTTILPVDCTYIHISGDRMSIGHDPHYWLKPKEWETTTEEEFTDLKDRVLLLAQIIGREASE